MHEFVTLQHSARPSRKAATLGVIAVLAILVSLSLTQVACVKDNPTFLVDAPVDGPPTGCVADPGKCTGATLVCEPGADVCVECLPGSAAACVGMEPVCSDTNMCRGCTEHSECASAVCLPDGSCAAETDVAYVTGGSGTGTTCTKAAPCATVTAALATPKATIKVTGAVVESTKLVVANTRRIFGAPNATVRASGGLNTIFEIPSGGNLTVVQLDVGGTVNLKPDRCYQIPSSATGTLALVGGKVSNCVLGVESLSSGSTVTVTGATVSGNTGAGITTNGGTVTVTGSTVTANIGGGISTTNSTVRLVNNFIFRNGNPTNAAFGGVSLASAVAGSVVDFNTIVDNNATMTGFSGISCLGNIVVVTNSIIANNRQNGGNVGPNAQVFLCTTATSAVAADSTLFLFRDDTAEPYDYHVKVGSVAIDAATTASAVITDVDGDARPQGASKDQGADEFKP